MNLHQIQLIIKYPRSDCAPKFFNRSKNFNKSSTTQYRFGRFYPLSDQNTDLLQTPMAKRSKVNETKSTYSYRNPSFFYQNPSPRPKISINHQQPNTKKLRFRYTHKLNHQSNFKIKWEVEHRYLGWP